MIKLDGNNIATMMVGDVPVLKVMVGSIEVWTNTTIVSDV